MNLTPFAEAVKVVPIPGSSSLFSATIPADWGATPAAHGGYLQSLIFSAARTYFQTYHPARNQPDPITAHLQFVKVVPLGAVRLVVKPVNLGSRVSIIQIEIQAPTPSPETFKTCLLSTVTQGNLATEQGVDLPTISILESFDVPDREKDCKKYLYPEYFKQLAPGAFKLQEWRVKDSLRGTEEPGRGRSVRENWYEFRDGTGFDVLSLGYLTDMFGGAPNNYVHKDIDYRGGIVYPTLSMVTEIKRDPKGCKWLFLRVQSYEIRNGRFDTNVTVLNENGELIALGKHVSLVLDRNSKVELKKIYRL